MEDKLKKIIQGYPVPKPTKNLPKGRTPLQSIQIPLVTKPEEPIHKTENETPQIQPPKYTKKPIVQQNTKRQKENEISCISHNIRSWKQNHTAIEEFITNHEAPDIWMLQETFLDEIINPKIKCNFY